MKEVLEILVRDKERYEDDLIMFMVCSKCGKAANFIEKRSLRLVHSSSDDMICSLCEKELSVNPWKPYLEKFQVKTLYYMAHRHNVESILKLGILPFKAIKGNAKKGNEIARVRIDDSVVQKQRAAKNPFGKNLHEYVPLYFMTKTPMQWVVTHKAPSRQSVIRPSDVVFIDVSTDVLRETGVVFSDGNASKELTKFYNKPEDLAKLNWQGMRMSPVKYKYDAEEWKRIRASEVLVPGGVGVKYFKRMVCFSSKIQEELGVFAKRVGVPVELDKPRMNFAAKDGEDLSDYYYDEDFEVCEA